MFETAADNSSILSIDLGLLIGLLVLKRLLDPSLTRDRILFGATVAALLAIYALWRWHDTLPAFAFSTQNLWQYFFFAFEALAIVYTTMSIVILCRNIDRSGLADAAQSRMEREGDFPSVDVFICTYDEPLEILEKSVLTALALDYPDFAVWVLDDTRRGWLREYCAAVGAHYVTRDNNRDAKAGNLNNGLAVTAKETNAPVILVLDADFAPRQDFLKRTVGLLSNPQVAVLQTPQFYYNPDPIQHNLLAAQSWVDDQRFFFDIFQPAKDAWGCAFCVGTSFVVRRDRLAEIGGFPSRAISEDINLTYTMLAKGYETWWLNEKLSIGLSAEGIPEYITQRARWCLGTIQVALLREGPLLGSGFTVIQRWHYLHGVLNWLCKPFMVLLLLAPSGLLVCGDPGVRGGLSRVLALWSAGPVGPDDLHGLDFEVAYASLFYGGNPCRDGFCDFRHASQRGCQAFRTAVQDYGQGRRPVRTAGTLEARIRLRLDLAKLCCQHHLGVCVAICRERDFFARFLQPALGRHRHGHRVHRIPGLLRIAAQRDTLRRR